MRTLSIDLETFCETDIKSAGAYKYAEKAEILLFAYRWDDEPVQLIDFTEFWGLDMHPSEYLPLDVWEALLDSSILKTAWNCSFERPVMQNVFGIELPAEQWKDTMVTAAMCGLPLSLGEAAKALNMEQEKDNTGKTLIRYFSIPCKPSKVNGMRSRNLPEHAPDKWEQFKNYCRQDVIVETEIAKKLEWYKIPHTERKLWFLDQKKNARGIKVDMVLIDQAIKMDKIFRDRLIAEASEITGLGNVNSVAQLKGWLEEETGDEVESLNKNSVTKLIGEVDSEKAKRVLEIRSLMAKSSIKKYVAMKNAAGVGDRIRGMIQYYGAQRTGRECLAENTRVLIKNKKGVYEKPIQEVLLTDLVFDGNDWVQHEGVVFSGDKHVITHDNICATEEHIVYLSDTVSKTLKEVKEKNLKIWTGNTQYIK